MKEHNFLEACYLYWFVVFMACINCKNFQSDYFSYTPSLVELLFWLHFGFQLMVVLRIYEGIGVESPIFLFFLAAPCVILCTVVSGEFLDLTLYSFNVFENYSSITKKDNGENIYSIMRNKLYKWTQ